MRDVTLEQKKLMQQRNITSYNIRTRLLQHQIHLAAT
jgi:hypothetical protein